MLKSTDLAVGMAMYQALTGSGSRQTALQAAAEEALSREDFWLLQGVMKAITPSRTQRNKFAHHLWGTSEDLPGKLLLADPTVFVKHLTNRTLYSRNPLGWHYKGWKIGKEAPLPELDHSKVQVYSERALKRAAKAAAEAGTLAFYLNIAIDRDRFGDGADQMRQRLLSVPVIQQTVEALSRENEKEVPPQPRPKRPSSKQRRTQALARRKKP
jgi:hypothetical protein